jgi:acetolactate synthase-like protein
LNGGELIAEILKKQGVKYLFTLCGGHISPILVGSKKNGIRVIDVRQESTAIFAADAISRLTGIPGVAAVTAGPGVTNSITAIKNAQMAESPLILLGGSAATVLKGRGALQDIEQIKLFKTLSKWSITIEQNCDIAPILNEAFDVSKSGIPGPVFIECPIDLLYDENLVREWYGSKSGVNESKSITDKVINWYLKRHVDKLFSCNLDKTELFEGEKIVPFAINQKEIELTLSMINNVKAPILIIGDQAMLRVDKVKDLALAIEKLNIPTYLTGMARGLLGEHHPLNLRHKRGSALKNADLVILDGFPIDFRLDYGRKINKDAILININRSKDIITKNRKPTLGIQADPSTFLIELINSPYYKLKEWKEWKEELNLRENSRENEIIKMSELRTDYINPLYLLRKIEEHLSSNSVIIGDGGDFISAASYILNPKKPLSWLNAGPFGTLGAGAGFAIAAKLVYPHSDIWLLYGDGAAGYSLIEIDTFKRHNLPIISIIGNDAGWTQISRDQIEYLNDDVGTVLSYNDYHLIADALGGKGIFLNNDKEINTTLEKAKDLSNKGNPVLINALIGKTDFRKGSISM